MLFNPMLDLNALPAYFITKYGLDKVAEVVGKSSSLVAMWQKKNKVPLDAVSKLVEFDPEPINGGRLLYSNPPAGTKLVILVPLSGPPEPKMMDSLMRLYDRSEMAYERFAFNNLSVSRNVLAARFLRGPYEWAWWQDGDTMVPSGDAEWYKREAGLPTMPDVFAGVNSIYRALFHKKMVVSCCYVGRAPGAPPQFGGGATPEMRARVKRGPRAELLEVPWVGFGGVLTHRSVFEDIVATQGDEIRMQSGGIGARFGYEYAFFSPMSHETPGDDLPFCQRAIRAGHKLYVDMAIQAAHIGDRPYTYNDL